MKVSKEICWTPMIALKRAKSKKPEHTFPLKKHHKRVQNCPDISIFISPLGFELCKYLGSWSFSWLWLWWCRWCCLWWCWSCCQSLPLAQNCDIEKDIPIESEAVTNCHPHPWSNEAWASNPPPNDDTLDTELDAPTFFLHWAAARRHPPLDRQ